MKKNLLVFAFLLTSFSAQSSAAVVNLPAPNTVVDGLPVAVPYDDFLSYSTQLLTQFGFSGFNGPAGVGGLDVVLLTQSGQNNDPVAGGFVFEDPVPSATGNTSSFSGTWGAGNQANGPVLVDNVLAYLHNQFGANNHIPVFTFDLAEPGNANARDLKFLAKFSVYDPVNNVDIAEWAIDAINNSAFDPAAFITIQGEISLTGLSNTVYTASNTGSGKYDFLVFSPTMDLSQFDGLGYEFRIFASFDEVDGSGEEAFIAGAFTTPVQPPPPTNNGVPEPATLTLLGLSGLAVGLRKTFRKR